jgi:DNA ligase D-like protein (predicted ligase)
MRSLLDSLRAEERRVLKPAPVPRFREPMKATLAREPFSREGWIFERKLDGIRCVGIREGDATRLYSRTGRELNRSYPEIVEALGAERCDRFAIDGEIVAFEGRVTSFARLQGRMQLSNPEAAVRTGIEVFYYVFDLVHLGGHETTELPLRARKSLVQKALSYKGPIRFVSHRNADGEAFFREACRRGLEGVVGKRAESRYRPGRRGGDWLKFKCVAEQEFVIGGFTAPKGSRTDFGALLVGYYADRMLHYAGKVGTGVGRDTLRRLGAKLRELETGAPPFQRGLDREPAGTHWVRPKLVAEVAFGQWTRDGRLRQPRYLGLREDKPPREVVRERPR